MKTRHVKFIPRSSLRFTLVLILLILACFALSPQARAVCQNGCDIPNLNTFLGDNAVVNNTTGIENTAIGANALLSNSTGFQDIALGGAALYSNTTGYVNMATGYIALTLNTTVFYNTATGTYALSYNATGAENTAIGGRAAQNNVTGSNNTAVGAAALFGSVGSQGSNNTATGFEAVLSNTTGNNNTTNGFGALVSNRAGSSNTASGYNALSSNITDSFNIALGVEAGGNLTTGSSNIDIANRGVAGEANTIRIGTREKHTNTFIAGISGATVAGGVAVIVDTNGQLGTVVSSERFKDAIKPMDKASEAILALKPVTFHYKHELDPTGIAQFGLVAEHVEKVNPDLVARDADGKPTLSATTR